MVPQRFNQKIVGRDFREMSRHAPWAMKAAVVAAISSLKMGFPRNRLVMFGHIFVCRLTGKGLKTHIITPLISAL